MGNESEHSLEVWAFYSVLLLTSCAALVTPINLSGSHV